MATHIFLIKTPDKEGFFMIILLTIYPASFLTAFTQHYFSILKPWILEQCDTRTCHCPFIFPDLGTNRCLCLEHSSTPLLNAASQTHLQPSFLQETFLPPVCSRGSVVASLYDGLPRAFLMILTFLLSPHTLIKVDRYKLQEIVKCVAFEARPK